MAPVLVGTILGLITIGILVAEHSAERRAQTLRLQVGVLQLKIK